MLLSIPFLLLLLLLLNRRCLGLLLQLLPLAQQLWTLLCLHLLLLRGLLRLLHWLVLRYRCPRILAAPASLATATAAAILAVAVCFVWHDRLPARLCCWAALRLLPLSCLQAPLLDPFLSFNPCPVSTAAAKKCGEEQGSGQLHLQARALCEQQLAGQGMRQRDLATHGLLLCTIQALSPLTAWEAPAQRSSKFSIFSGAPTWRSAPQSAPA